jgi:hypothetical protein
MEAVCTSETSVNFYRTTHCHIPDYGILRSQRRENLKCNYAFRVLCQSLSRQILGRLRKLGDDSFVQHTSCFPVHYFQSQYHHNYHKRRGLGPLFLSF